MMSNEIILINGTENVRHLFIAMVILNYIIMDKLIRWIGLYNLCLMKRLMHVSGRQMTLATVIWKL